MLRIRKELTPEAMLCGMVGQCPAAYELEDGSILIIGKKVKMEEIPSDVKNRIAIEETVVIVPRELLRMPQK